MKPILTNFLFFLIATGITSIAFAQDIVIDQDTPIQLQYKLLPGMDLIFTATFELNSEGGYSEVSTRVIESRFIVLDIDDAGTANLFGLSRMLERSMEGQSIEAPYGNIFAYEWQWNPISGEHHISSSSAEFGTGWTPMVYFPPLPKVPVKLNERAESVLPLYVKQGEAFSGPFSVLTQHHPVKTRHLNIASSLSEPVVMQSDPNIAMEYLEHEITYNTDVGLPERSVTGYQIHIQDGGTESYADIRIESTLTQSNVFREQHQPVIRQEIAKFFDYQKQLSQMSLDQAAELIDLLIDFSENSPMPLLRDAAKDLVLKHRYDLRLKENWNQSQPGWEVPLFTAFTVNGDEFIFDPNTKIVRVLLFWSLWWEPSEHALLDLEELRKTLNPKKVQFTGINLDSHRGGVGNYLERTGIGMETVWDKDYPRSGMAFRFGVQQVPVIIVVDKNGVIAARDIPFSELVKLLSKLL